MPDAVLFEPVRSEIVASLNLTVEEYRHPATGARHFHLASDDDNNAFLVAFLTVPGDSTGVAHILEHTSLCGSRHFPVRDPFFMMSRRSLNTFMNAFTSSDWTAYPFATQNRKDFDNLLRVYLDAAFFPRLDPLDFAQEGHRLEFERPDDMESALVFKGVVYNEMKGAMSSPVSRLWQALHEHLFPTLTYHYNSGGDPVFIPNLTHEELKAFHARHYHPSNAVFMTYGDIPAAVHQARIQELALGEFERQDLDLKVPDERRYTVPLEIETHYPLDGETDTRDKSHVVLGWLLGPATELRPALEAQLLSSVLLDNGASPLRHALETTDLGTAPSELCGVDDSPREACFFAGLEGTNPELTDQVNELVLSVIEQVAQEGVPREIVESVLHQMELSQREVRGGHFPYGLRLMLNALSPALHDGDPVGMLNLDPVLEEMRQAIQNPEYIKGLVRRMLVDNPHRVTVSMVPDPALSERERGREKARLAELRAALTGDDKERIVAQTRALKARQVEKDDPDLLPKVTLEDVPRERRIAGGREEPVAGMPVSWYAQGTNGLVYTQVVAEFPALDPDTLDLVPLFADCMPELGCGDRDYLEAQVWQAAVTGGVSAHPSLRSEIDDLGNLRGYMVVAGKALARNQRPLAQVLREVFQKARFDELPRLRELVAQMRAQREMSITDHGHVLAMTAAGASLSPAGALAHRWNGLWGIRRLKELDRQLQDEAALAEFARDLAGIRDAVLAMPRRFLAICEPQQQDAMQEALRDSWEGLPAAGAGMGFQTPALPDAVDEGWMVSTQVNFCARAYPTVPVEHPDAPALMVLGRFLTNGFLHRAVREQGGAYGAGGGYDSDSGVFRFYSYRDPRIEDTLEDFDRSLDWLQGEKHEYRQLEEAVLGVVSAIDRPDSPAGEASRTFFGILHGRTPEQRRRFRERILSLSLADLQRAGNRWLVPGRARTAVVSDPQTLKSKAGALGLELRELS